MDYVIAAYGAGTNYLSSILLKDKGIHKYTHFDNINEYKFEDGNGVTALHYIRENKAIETLAWLKPHDNVYIIKSDLEDIHYYSILFYLKRRLRDIDPNSEHYEKRYTRFFGVKNVNQLHPSIPAYSPFNLMYQEQTSGPTSEGLIEYIQTTLKDFLSGVDKVKNREVFDMNEDMRRLKGEFRYKEDYPSEVYDDYIHIDYKDLFIDQKPTGTVFDKYMKENKEYHKRNLLFIHKFSLLLDIDLMEYIPYERN